MYTRPTFMGFESARSAIFANQKSLDIVGNNLANVNTAGYTRQSVDRASMVVPMYSAKNGTGNIGLAGQGVQSLGVSQTRDAMLDQRFRQEYSNSAYYAKSASILEEIQLALGDGYDITDESGLYGSMIQIYESLNTYMQDPTSESQANIVMSAFSNACQVLQQMSSNLTSVAVAATDDLKIDVNRVNEIAAQIAELNGIIEDDAASNYTTNNYFGPNELYDQRNLLLDELSAYGDITVTEHANGVIDVSLGGFTMVNGSDSPEYLNLVVNDDYSVSMNWVSTGESYQPSSGLLLGAIQIINGNGSNCTDATDEPYKGIPYYQSQIDTFASALADVANNTIPYIDEDGQPLTDNNGNIIYKQLIGAKLSNGNTSLYGVDATNISISSDWITEGAGFFIFSTDEHVEDYAQQLALKLTEQSYTFKNGNETFEGTFFNFEVNFLANLATDISFNAGRQDAYALIANDLITQRDAVAGVSSDEETADMMIYQNSYNAASRMMTVFDELLDVIINNTGHAGR